MEILIVRIDSVRANVDGLGITLSWVDDRGYHGEIDFEASKIGNHICIDSEYMGKDFVKKALAKLVDDAKLEE